MTKRSVVSLAIKVLGVFLLLNVLLVLIPLFFFTLSWMTGNLGASYGWMNVAIAWLSPALKTGTGLLLIFSSDALSSRLIVGDVESESGETVSSLTKEDFFIFIVFAVGVWATLYGFSGTVRNIHVIVRASGGGVSVAQAAAAGTATEFLIALFMAVRARRITQWIARFQH